MRSVLLAVGVQEVHQGYNATVVSIVHFRLCRKSCISPAFQYQTTFLSPRIRNAVDKLAPCVLRDVLRCSLTLSSCSGGGFASDV
jgi:hypothetical protein